MPTLSPIWHARTTGDEPITIEVHTLSMLTLHTDAVRGPMSMEFKIEVKLLGDETLRAFNLEQRHAESLGQWMNAHSESFYQHTLNHTIVWGRKMLTAEQTMRRQNDAVSANIDVQLEQVIMLARECGKSDEFAGDIAPALRSLLGLMIRDELQKMDTQRREAFRAFTNVRLGEPLVRDGKVPSGLPVEEKLRDGEKPFGYVVGMLSKEAHEALSDLVRHGADMLEAISHGIVNCSAPNATKTDSQRIADTEFCHVQDRRLRGMLNKARIALEIHDQVSK